MKKFFAKASSWLRYAAVSAFVFIGNAATNLAFAQTGVGDSIAGDILDSTATGMTGLATRIVRILQIAVGLGGLINLIIVVFNIIQGEREAAKKAGWWLVGLVLGFTALTVLGNRIGRM